MNLSAELLVYSQGGLFDFNAAYCRDGGTANIAGGWASAGVFNSVRDALVEGRERMKAAKRKGVKRGNRSIPRIRVAA